MQKITFKKRFRFAAKLASVHLFVSIFIACLVASLVFLVWFPSPYREMIGIDHLFFTIIAVDVVCGPLLTLILATPTKRSREVFFDFLFIAVIQLCALFYGMYSVALSRPVAEVFEVDRVVVVTQRELLIDSKKPRDEAYANIPWFSRLHVASDLSKQSTIEGLELSLQGISPAQRVHLWVPRDTTKEAMQKALKPLSILASTQPNADIVLKKLMQKYQLSSDNLYFLPFTYDKKLDWIIIFDKELNIIDYENIDGFVIKK